MNKLNQYAIGRILGSKMIPLSGRARFGNFGLLSTVGDVLNASHSPSREDPHFSYPEDTKVVKAFEEVRDGASPDSLLWNKKLAKEFHKRCRELGLRAPGAYVTRRLIHVRKNSPRYAEHGILISPTTKNEPHESIVHQYAHAIEFALVRLRYLYGASIDDILMDRRLGDAFEEMAAALAPGLSSQDLRLGALYIRKSRFLKKKALNKIQRLDINVVQKELTPPVTLDRFEVTHLPHHAAVVEIKEHDRYLYIARTEDLQPTVEELKTGRAFELMSNSFWTPHLDEISLQFVAKPRIDGVGLATWERLLIHDLQPVFNWPMQKKMAA
jgi:hypothetical protein